MLYPGPVSLSPCSQCCNQQPVRNPVLGCLEPVVTHCGTIAEVPFNLANVGLPALSSMPVANPFLPIASPVSPYMQPISPCLPQASPCNNRCQYLKKIPIPPPCI